MASLDLLGNTLNDTFAGMQGFHAFSPADGTGLLKDADLLCFSAHDHAKRQTAQPDLVEGANFLARYRLWPGVVRDISRIEYSPKNVRRIQVKRIISQERIGQKCAALALEARVEQHADPITIYHRAENSRQPARVPARVRPLPDRNISVAPNDPDHEVIYDACRIARNGWPVGSILAIPHFARPFSKPLRQVVQSYLEYDWGSAARFYTHPPALRPGHVS